MLKRSSLPSWLMGKPGSTAIDAPHALPFDIRISHFHSRITTGVGFAPPPRWKINPPRLSSPRLLSSCLILRVCSLSLPPFHSQCLHIILSDLPIVNC